MRHGQGWIANPQTDDPLGEVRGQVDRLGELCTEAGRDVAGMRRLLLTGFTDEPWLASPAAYDDLAGRYAGGRDHRRRPAPGRDPAPGGSRTPDVLAAIAGADR
ncbi:hypothetical protein [Nocardioides sp. TF02-7]|uniref:hypothetical protein n=1 Tax=Nocardioides sp. TF02-7 TaxID=2917724 RepID=UPI001F05760F|nr:hypothetical protein [Nocardioides sp. TF02-7]UMG92572.1 hypothetical protein MF408_22660 [Nocardioides sp. TF02-7]